METVSRILLTFLLNAGWQIALITAVAAVCAWLLRKTSARYRHLLWVSALALSLGLPILTCSQIIREAVFNKVPTPNTVVSNPTVVPRSSSGVIAHDSVVETAAPFGPELPARFERENRPVQISRDIALIIVALYLLLVLYRGIRLLRAWIRTVAIRRDAYSLNIVDSIGTHERVKTVVGRCQRLINVNRVRILWSRSVPMPITVGTIDPLVILPEQLLQEPDTDVLTSAVGHELVHILRCDYLFNLVYEFIYALLAFYPAVVLIRRNINQTRELGCDELVTEKLLTPHVYARSLVHLAGSTIPTDHPMTTMTVGINDANILEERVKAMLKKPNATVRRKSLQFVSALLCLAVPCVAAVPLGLRVGIHSASDDAKKQQVEEKTRKQQAELEAIENKRKQERIRAELNELPASNRISSTGRLELEAHRREEALRENRQRELEATKRRAEEAAKEKELQDRRDSEYVAADLLKDERVRVMRGNAEFFSPMTEAQKKEFEAASNSERQNRAKRQIELVRQAKINMQQAVRIATSHQAGTVMECSLGRERDTIFYRVLIVSGEQELKSTRILINAIDGQVISVNRE